MTFGTPMSRRERQIMEILYRTGQATVGEVLAALPDPPSYSAVRALLRILEEKGHARHTRQGMRYLYEPAEPRAGVARSALAHVVHTFFAGSIEKAVAALVSQADTRLSDEELVRLAEMIERERDREAPPSIGDGPDSTEGPP